MTPMEIKEVATRAKAMDREEKQVVMTKIPLLFIKQELERRERITTRQLLGLGYSESTVKGMSLEEKIRIVRHDKKVLGIKMR